MATTPHALGDAGQALARGEPLRALALTGRDHGASATLMRGIAYAQVGDLELAQTSLERAVALADDAPTRARARAALAEIALSTQEPGAARDAASAAADELARVGDARNAAMQRLVVARAEVLLGRLTEARRVVAAVVAEELAPDLRALALLTQAETAIRAVATSSARDALRRAREVLRAAPNPLLARELVGLEEQLTRPLARLARGGVVRDADLFVVEAASNGDVLLVDACRRLAIGGRVTVPLARRPVLFALLFALARGFPAAVPREELAAHAFDVRRVNASHHARLRVEIGRLRKVMDGLHAAPVATSDGYVLASERDVVMLLPPTDGDDARVALLLGDGASWSARGLAEHAGVSVRTAQRVLAELVARGAAVRSGTGRHVRYTRPGTPLASRMLLLGLVPRA